MIDFNPKKLPCDLEELGTEIDGLLEVEEKLNSCIKILYIMLEKVDINSYISNKDFEYSFEHLVDISSLIGHKTATLKAKINYLLEEKL